MSCGFGVLARNKGSAMKWLVFLFAPLVFLAMVGGTARGEEFDHSAWDRVLKTFPFDLAARNYGKIWER